jgi:hypothetical protein
MHSTCVRNLGTVEFSDRDYKNRVKRKIHALIIFMDYKGRTQRESSFQGFASPRISLLNDKKKTQ